MVKGFALQIKTQEAIIHKENQGQNYQNLLHDYQDILQLPLKQIRNLKINIGFRVVIKKGIRNSVIRQMYSNEMKPDHSFFLYCTFLRSINLTLRMNFETERIGFVDSYLPLGSHKF